MKFDKYMDLIKNKVKCKICTFADDQVSMVEFKDGWVHRDCLDEKNRKEECVECGGWDGHSTGCVAVE